MVNLRDDIDVLHVDDDGQFVELAATFVERHDDGIAVETTTDPERALELLSERRFDCLVSDYQMPRLDGLELFGELRDRGIDVPFVLFTGKGSEEIASEAISLGITEYLQKETGTEQYEVLANRIRNVVSQHRAETRMKRGYRALDAAPVGVLLVDVRQDRTPVVYANSRFRELAGCDSDDLLGKDCRSVLENGDPTAPVRRLCEAIRAEVAVSGELIGYRTNGTELEGRIDVVPIANEAGETTHFVGFLAEVHALSNGECLSDPDGPLELDGNALPDQD